MANSARAAVAVQTRQGIKGDATHDAAKALDSW